MIENMFKAILVTTAVGSALAAVITLLRPVTKRVFGYKWHYYIWLAVLAVMVLPVRFTFPAMERIEPPEVSMMQAPIEESVDTQGEKINTNTNPTPVTYEERTAYNSVNIMEKLPSDIWYVLGIIWLVGAGGMLGLGIVSYIRLVRRVRRDAVAQSCPQISEYTARRLTVCKCRGLSSPFIMGIFRPSLVLPEVELTEEQLRNIIMHETTHLNRNDILYKWFAFGVRCIHWFNPFAYYVSRQINAECEISCDLSVVEHMSSEQEMEYVNTIISLLSQGRGKTIPLTTGMTGNKKILKRRFTMIKNKKPAKRLVSVLSALIALILLGTTVFASGVVSGLITEDYTIRITISGEEISFKNKPLFYDNTVYIPLRETAEKIGIPNDDNNRIIWDNGKITIYVENDIDYYELNIGSNKIEVDSVSPEVFGMAEKEERNAPVLMNGTTYVPFEYINFIYNRMEYIYDIQYTFGKITSHSPYLNNAEGKTYADICDVQYMVDNGHFPWQLDPQQVIKAYVQGMNIGDGEITSLAGDGVSVSAMYSTKNGTSYIIELFKPVQKDEHGIWVVKSVGNGDNSFDFTAEEINSAKAVIEDYYKALAAKDREAILKNMADRYDKQNVIFYQEENVILDDIRYVEHYGERESYITYGRGSVDNTKMENVIVFKVDFTAEVYGKSVYSDGKYTDYNIILVRDGKDGKWLISDMGY